MSCRRALRNGLFSDAHHPAAAEASGVATSTTPQAQPKGPPPLHAYITEAPMREERARRREETMRTAEREMQQREDAVNLRAVTVYCCSFLPM